MEDNIKTNSAPTGNAVQLVEGLVELGKRFMEISEKSREKIIKNFRDSASGRNVKGGDIMGNNTKTNPDPRDIAAINIGQQKFELAKDYELGRNGKEIDLNMARCLYEQSLEAGYQPSKEALTNVGNVGAAVLATAETLHIQQIYLKLADELANLNTMRGGIKGFKGFVAEELQAAEASVAGRATLVINDNGAADLLFTGRNGHKYLEQLKIGYKSGGIDFAKYKGQRLLVDKGNPYLKQFQAEGAKYGVKVLESNITNEETKTLATWMQRETALTGAKEAVLTPKIFSMHKAGMVTARTGALYSCGFSLGANVVDVLSGDKEIGDAAADVAVDTAIGAGVSYAAGAVGSTAVGSAVIGAVSTGATTVAGAVTGAASTVAGAVGSTAVGGAVIGAASAGAAAVGTATGAVAGAVTGAASAVAGAVGAVGSAVGTGAVAATTAVAGTAAGAAVASGVAATAAAGTAVGAALGAAAPVVLGAAAVGAVCKLIKKFF